jgi:hypothetical protein
MHYDLGRIHRALKMTLATAVNVTPKRYELSDMVEVLEGWATQRAPV